jgi:UDP-GlcNAc:undecaprenyl-phosphate GlcNAc-1-phosphate transferase
VVFSPDTLSALAEVFAVVSVFTFGACLFIRWMGFKFKLLDYPEPLRRVHSKPVPRNGGWALYAAVLVGALLFLPTNMFWVQGMLLAMTVVFAASILDDIYDLSPAWQFASHVAAGIILFYFGVTIERITNPFAAGGFSYLEYLSFPATVLWVVLIINAINFVDGLDGLAAGVAGIASVSFAIISLEQGKFFVAVLCVILLGVTLGFLPLNFHPAMIFMGTTGSAVLGIMLATITIQGTLKITSTVSLLLPLLVLGVPFFDASFAVVRRFKNRMPIFRPDRGHVHHRLINVGFSHRRAVFLIYGWCATMSALGLAIGYKHVPAIVAAGTLAAGSTLLMARLLEIDWRFRRKGPGWDGD